MTDKILANEIFVMEDGARIRTRCDRKFITDEVVGQWAAYTRLDVDDVVSVACMTHERDVVLWRRSYLVAGRQDFLKQTPNMHGDVKHEETFRVRVVPLDDWLEVTPIAGKDKTEEDAPAALGFAWNVGRKVYVVTLNGEEVYETADKDLAEQIVKGEIPIPAEAA